MPRIIIQANPPGGERDDVTLSERVTSANLDDLHYGTQLLKRLTWATADAEALERQASTREPGEDPAASPLLRQPNSVRDGEPISKAGVNADPQLDARPVILVLLSLAARGDRSRPPNHHASH
jgi:hypothetical protein